MSIKAIKLDERSNASLRNHILRGEPFPLSSKASARWTCAHTHTHLGFSKEANADQTLTPQKELSRWGQSKRLNVVGMRKWAATDCRSTTPVMFSARISIPSVYLLHRCHDNHRWKSQASQQLAVIRRRVDALCGENRHKKRMLIQTQ